MDEFRCPAEPETGAPERARLLLTSFTVRNCRIPAVALPFRPLHGLEQGLVAPSVLQVGLLCFIGAFFASIAFFGVIAMSLVA